MLRMRGRVGEASAKALAGGEAARGRTARGEAAGLSGGRSLPYNDSAERRGILPHRTEKRKSMREGFRAGAFFLCAKGEGARGKGQEKREAGLWCGFVQIGKTHGWRQKEGPGSGCGPAENRASGWVGKACGSGGREETQKEAAGARQRAGEEIDGKGNREIHGERGPLREIAAGGRDGGESADGTGSWTSICMGGGCGKVEQKAAQLIEDVRARGEEKAMLMEQGERKFWSRKGQGSAKGRNAWREGRGRTRKVRVEKDGACISLRRGGGWTEGGIDLREVCAGKNIFTKFRNDTAQLMESVRARGRKKQC